MGQFTSQSIRSRVTNCNQSRVVTNIILYPRGISKNHMIPSAWAALHLLIPRWLSCSQNVDPIQESLPRYCNLCLLTTVRAAQHCLDEHKMSLSGPWGTSSAKKSPWVAHKGCSQRGFGQMRTWGGVKNLMDRKTGIFCERPLRMTPPHSRVRSQSLRRRLLLSCCEWKRDNEHALISRAETAKTRST